MSELERITARRGELDALAEELGKRLQEVQAEREELAIAERVLLRLAEQDRAEAEAAAATAPVKAQVAGRAVLLIPHRGDSLDETALPETIAGFWRSCGPPRAPCRSGRWARSWALRWRCAGNWSRCG
ncbi:hypothetical protein ABZ705_30805 [Streptomyces sp. NPDC006984]|uniref:hypothetical protein n=1 Tax=Streptomyces sp. NPDC006984 TaxID=3155463 RepID=UPI0033C49F5F